jgi:hypothetical protein
LVEIFPTNKRYSPFRRYKYICSEINYEINPGLDAIRHN